MSERRPRRSRRRETAPATTLPRPSIGSAPRKPVSRDATPAYRPARDHHVTTDYRYVRSDLILLSVVGAVTLGFVLVTALFF